MDSALSGWGSAMIGGLVSGTIVLIGVRYTQFLLDRHRRGENRRQAAADLMVEISNVRDEACSNRAGLIGDYQLASLRNLLFTTRPILHRDGAYDGYEVVDEYYKKVKEWREWARAQVPQTDTTDRDRARDENRRRVQSIFPWTTAYMKTLAAHGDAVIEVLQRQLDAATVNFDPGQFASLQAFTGREGAQ